MTITANSKSYEIDNPSTVGEFIEKMGENPKRCVVELNGNAMRFEQFKDLPLNDGDVLEVMRIVAGG